MPMHYTGKRRTKCPVLVISEEPLCHVREINQNHHSGEPAVSEWGLLSLDLGIHSAAPINSDPGSKKGTPGGDDFFLER